VEEEYKNTKLLEVLQNIRAEETLTQKQLTLEKTALYLGKRNTGWKHIRLQGRPGIRGSTGTTSKREYYRGVDVGLKHNYIASGKQKPDNRRMEKWTLTQ